jgi:hypothetical protein
VLMLLFGECEFEDGFHLAYYMLCYGLMKGGEPVCIDRMISAWSTDPMAASATSSGAIGRLS